MSLTIALKLKFVSSHGCLKSISILPIALWTPVRASDTFTSKLWMPTRLKELGVRDRNEPGSVVIQDGAAPPPV